MKSSKFIIITSINQPTKAVYEFSKWSGWTTIVVGDKKSSPIWECNNVIFLSVERQILEYPEFANYLPFNSYVRKMIGYLYAFKNGASAIFETDDDNTPYPNAASVLETNLFSDRLTGSVVSSESGWLNVYSEFGVGNCWPRGFPLEFFMHPKRVLDVDLGGFKWGVLQYLADKDPDVDAIYRMTHSGDIFFARDHILRLAERTFSPFNSQATLWIPETFPLMFLPLGVTDRVTDILRGYISLSCLWRCGYTIAYASPVVYQERNVHNLLRDFEQESDLYRYADQWSRKLISLDDGHLESNPILVFRAALDLLINDGTLPKINRLAYEYFVQHIISQKK